MHGYGIKALLKKLDVPNSVSEVVDFVVAFGPFFYHIFANFQRKNDAQTKMAPKEDYIPKAWNLANDSNKRVEQMEEALHQDDGDVTTLDA